MLTDFMVGPFILMYHSIDDHPEDPYSVTGAAFRAQMRWLSQRGFETVPLATLLHLMERKNHRALRKKVVITFDDGCRDFVTNALPILREHRATATVFLVTELLGRSAAWMDPGSRVPLMSVEEVRYIKSHGFALGSHTASHARLTTLGGDELERQLVDSRDRLAWLGETFHTLAYPWGQWSEPVARAARAAGYRCALAVGETTRLDAGNLYQLPRITMRRDLDLARFQSLLTRTRVEMELRRGLRLLLRGRRTGPPAGHGHLKPEGGKTE